MPGGEYCEHCDLPLSMCQHGRPPAEPPGNTMFQDNKGPWFPAKYPGSCSSCDDGTIEPGDMIRADGDGGWECNAHA